MGAPTWPPNLDGGLDMAPKPPNARSGPGNPCRSPTYMGAPTWPPYPPTLGAARGTRAARQLRWGPRHGPHTPQCSERPGEPVPLANLDGGPDMAPIPPNARSGPGNPSPLPTKMGTSP